MNGWRIEWIPTSYVYICLYISSPFSFPFIDVIQTSTFQWIKCPDLQLTYFLQNLPSFLPSVSTWARKVVVILMMGPMGSGGGSTTLVLSLATPEKWQEGKERSEKEKHQHISQSFKVSWLNWALVSTVHDSILCTQLWNGYYWLRFANEERGWEKFWYLPKGTQLVRGRDERETWSILTPNLIP